MKKYLPSCRLAFSLSCLLLIILISIGCGQKKHITGTVVDERGQAVAGVAVKIENAAFATTTGDAGEYRLDFAPGKFRVIFAKSGYVGDTLALELSEKIAFPAETVTLYRIPEERGIFVLSDSGYQALPRVSIRERVYEVGTFIKKRYHRAFMPVGAPVAIAQTECTFLDFDPATQHLLRLNSRGEIGKLVTIMMGMVESTVFEFVKEVLEQIAPDIWKRRARLSPGRYAFVPFVKDNFGNSIPARRCYYFEVVGEREESVIE